MTPKMIEFPVEIETEHGEVTFVVKFKDQLSDGWLNEWEESFDSTNTMEEHAKNIASLLAAPFKGKSPSFLVGYGPVKLTGMRTWELVVLDASGDKTTTVEIERLVMVQQGKGYGRKKNR